MSDLVTEPVRTTVLVVDDDDDMRLLLKLRLELSGRIDVVDEAVDGIDALESFARLDPPPVPQVIVLDNRMPGMTGLDVAAQLVTAKGELRPPSPIPLVCRSGVHRLRREEVNTSSDA